MYKDIIHYNLAKGVSEDKLLQVAQNVLKNWMSNQPGFVSWSINKNEKNRYTDIVCWESIEDAKNAEGTMLSYTNVQEWISCYENESIISENLIELFKSTPL